MSEQILLVQIKFFSSTKCAFCPAAKIILKEVLEQGQLEALVEVIFVNIDDHPEVAFELGIMALPAILIKAKSNEQMFVGLPDPEQLKSTITTYVFGGIGDDT